MADTGYYYGWETKCYLAVESTYGTASTTAGDYMQPAYVRSLGWKQTENIENIYVPGGSSRRGHEDEVKGMKEITANVEFWMSDDFGASGVEPFLCKFALDKYNTAVATSTWAIPESGGTYPGDSTFGSYSLLPFSMEVGFNKTSNIRRYLLTGCYVGSETVNCEMGEKVTWTWDIVAQNLTKAATAFVGTGTQATGAPLDWSGVRIKWTGEDDTATYHTGCEGVEWTTDNKLEPLMELIGITQDRMVDGFYTQGREISGTMKWKKKTTAGQKWFEILFSATKDKTTSDDTIQLGALIVEIASGTSGCSLAYTLADVIIGEVPVDVEFDKVQVLTLPITARSITAALVTVNTTQAPTSWDSQAA